MEVEGECKRSEEVEPEVAKKSLWDSPVDKLIFYFIEKKVYLQLFSYFRIVSRIMAIG